MNHDGTDLWQVGQARSELNSDLTIRHGDGKSLVDGSQRSPSRGNDVKVGQDLRTVDRDIKDALSRLGPIGFRKFKDDVVAAIGDGERIREIAIPFRLDRNSTRLNSSHTGSSYAVFCLKTNVHAPT